MFEIILRQHVNDLIKQLESSLMPFGKILTKINLQQNLNSIVLIIQFKSFHLEIFK